MKLVINRPSEKFKVGDRIEAAVAEAAVLLEDGSCITASEWDANQSVIQAKANEKEAGVNRIGAACVRAVERKALLPKGDAANALDTVKAKMLARFERGTDAETLCELVDAMPGEVTVQARQTTSTGTGTVETPYGAEPTGAELVKAAIHACQPFQSAMKEGGLLGKANNNVSAIVRATDLSMEKSRLMAMLSKEVQSGFVIRAANTNYVDPASNNPLGLLNTELMVINSLGHLESQLAPLLDITTNIAGQPVQFNQRVGTRYFTIPGVQLKTGSTSWSGGTGTNVDVDVALNTYAGVDISLNNVLIASTPRNIFKEQYDPQLYGLGKYITFKMVDCIINGSTRTANDGTTQSTIKFCNGGTGQPAAFAIGGIPALSLATFTSALPAAMDLAEMPGGDEAPGAAMLQRFAWVHTRPYSSITADSAFMLNQSIWGSRNAGTNGNLMETGVFERIGNIKFRKSQLISDQCAATGSGADGTTNAITVAAGNYDAATTVGFAGTKSSLLFVSRVPEDYTKVMPGIPASAALEVVSSPQLGISFLIVKSYNHASEVASCRVQLMFGFGVGDERQGILLNKS